MSFEQSFTNCFFVHKHTSLNRSKGSSRLKNEWMRVLRSRAHKLNDLTVKERIAVKYTQLQHLLFPHARPFRTLVHDKRSFNSEISFEETLSPDWRWI